VGIVYVIAVINENVQCVDECKRAKMKNAYDSKIEKEKEIPGTQEDEQSNMRHTQNRHK